MNEKTTPALNPNEDELLFKKRGEMKSGLFSKSNAGTFYFFPDRIVFKPAGLNRLFNSAEILIPGSQILSVEPSFRIIGYLFIVKTTSQRFWLSFLGDKKEIGKLLYSYVIKNES